MYTSYEIVCSNKQTRNPGTLMTESAFDFFLDLTIFRNDVSPPKKIKWICPFFPTSISIDSNKMVLTLSPPSHLISHIWAFFNSKYHILLDKISFIVLFFLRQIWQFVINNHYDLLFS